MIGTLFSWWRERRRRKLLAEPFPVEWDDILRRHVPHFHSLKPDEQERLRRDTRYFVAEKHWEGCRGLEVTDEVRVTIAGTASLLGLGFEQPPFDRLLSVLIYPETYVAPETKLGPGGVVVESAVPRLGEAWYRGPVILSWPDVLYGCQTPDDGHNVVLHEFAHLLDMLDRDVDGVPPIDDAEQYHTWKEVTTAEYERLVRDARLGRRTLLDYYGATSPSEFFAVATESFFEQPREMRELHPSLYAVMAASYRQDPAARLDRATLSV